MFKNEKIKIGRIVAWLSIVPVLFTIFLVNALAIVPSRTVEYSPPPEFLRQAQATEPNIDTTADVQQIDTEATPEPNEEGGLTAAMVRVKSENPTDELIHALAFGDRAARIDAVNALVESLDMWDYAAKQQFWQSTEGKHHAIMHAMYEALEKQVEDGDATFELTYLIAWSPAQDERTLEVLSWAAKNHPNPVDRRCTAFYVIKIAPRSDLAKDIIRDFRADPSVRNRLEAISYQSQVWIAPIEDLF